MKILKRLAKAKRKYAKHWNAAMIITGIFCLTLGGIYLPPPFPNGFPPVPSPQYQSVRLNVPRNLTMPYDNQTSYLQIELQGQQFVIGENLTLTVWVSSSPTLDRHIDAVDAVPDGSLNVNHPSSPGGAPVFEALALVDTGNGWWKGAAQVEFTVSGSLGLTVYMYLHSVTMAVIPTGPMYTIYTQDFVVAKTNQALTTGLTFFLLFFAALESRIREQPRLYRLPPVRRKRPKSLKAKA